jgi:predicted nucleotidyltransferase
MKPVLTKADVLDRLSSHGAVIRNAGVKRLGLFGSFLHDRPNLESDVDLLVEFDAQRKTFDNYWLLAELLECQLDRPVDLLTIESLSLYIGPRILAEVEYVPLGTE